MQCVTHYLISKVRCMHSLVYDSDRFKTGVRERANERRKESTRDVCKANIVYIVWSAFSQQSAQLSLNTFFANNNSSWQILLHANEAMTFKERKNHFVLWGFKKIKSICYKLFENWTSYLLNGLFCSCSVWVCDFKLVLRVCRLIERTPCIQSRN